MSLGIVIKGPEGLVLAAESRLTLSVDPPGGKSLHVNFDNATKLLSFSTPNEAVGAVTYGAAAIGMRSAHSFLPEFESGLPPERLKVKDFADRLSTFFTDQWKSANLPTPPLGQGMTFVVGGFDDGEPYGQVYVFEVPGAPDLKHQNTGDNFGLTWGGQREWVDRIVQGYDGRLADVLQKTLSLDPTALAAVMTNLQGQLQMPVPIAALALQDCVDLAIFFIRTTIVAQKLTVGIRGCGGPIDVATITRRQGFRYVQRKRIYGELGPEEAGV